MAERVLDIGPAEGGRIRHFPGGLKLRHHKQVSCSSPVERPPLPPQLVIPMQQHSGPEAEVLVAPGDQVLRGQRIGEPRGDRSAAVHAPTSGTVTAVETRPITHPSRSSGICVVLEPDGQDAGEPMRPIRDWQQATPQQLADRIRDAGIVGLGGAVFPTHLKLQPALHTVILNGAECEPYIACDEMLMREQPQRIIEGGRILARLVGAARLVIGIEDQMGAVRQSFDQADTQGEAPHAEVVRVRTIYPEGGERQLIQVLTGQEVPADGYPTDLGLLVVNVATAAAVADAVVRGQPLIERIVTVTGPGIHSPRNWRALLGTPVSHLVDASGGYRKEAERLVIGGPLMGYAIPDDTLPVVKASNCVLALTAEDLAGREAEMPCIRCGECARVCPATLQPQELQSLVRHERWQEAMDQRLAACIECACCDLVCPSHIPLTAWFRFGKQSVREFEADRQRAQHARERFEAREARLERQKRERASKRAARREELQGRGQKQRELAEAVARARKKREENTP